MRRTTRARDCRTVTRFIPPDRALLRFLEQAKATAELRGQQILASLIEDTITIAESTVTPAPEKPTRGK